jgi:hypothetical protein
MGNNCCGKQANKLKKGVTKLVIVTNDEQQEDIVQASPRDQRIFQSHSEKSFMSHKHERS